ncbi:MAG: hypothetical protein P8Y45_12110 [Exilibacterium sp.]
MTEAATLLLAQIRKRRRNWAISIEMGNLKSYEQVQEVIESTYTEKGLKVITYLLDKIYEKGK